MTDLRSDASVIRSFNVGLLLTMLVLFGLGLATVYSASRGVGMAGLYKTQLMWFGISIAVGLVVMLVDAQVFEKLAYPFYGMAVLLLVVVEVVGEVGGGSQRWIRLGPFNVQPSEIAKLAIVMILAKYFAQEKEGPPYTLRRLVVPGLMVAPMFLLILKQPDLGTAGVLFLVSASMIYFLKVHWKSIAVVAIIGAIMVPVAYKFVLHDYQRKRVLTFLNPGRDALGSGYNALQCKIAVGSGRVVGKGWLKGTQSQLNFIPEQHTDFIFSVYAEERGFLGSLLLLALYGTYCLFALRTVARARDKFQMLLAFGVTAIIFWHVVINIGMVIGLLPVVGVGLPFFSYGGSMLLTFMLATAILLNLSRKRYIF